MRCRTLEPRGPRSTPMPTALRSEKLPDTWISFLLGGLLQADVSRASAAAVSAGENTDVRAVTGGATEGMQARARAGRAHARVLRRRERLIGRLIRSSSRSRTRSSSRRRIGERRSRSRLHRGSHRSARVCTIVDSARRGTSTGIDRETTVFVTTMRSHPPIDSDTHESRERTVRHFIVCASARVQCATLRRMVRSWPKVRGVAWSSTPRDVPAALEMLRFSGHHQDLEFVDIRHRMRGGNEVPRRRRACAGPTVVSSRAA